MNYRKTKVMEKSDNDNFIIDKPLIMVQYKYNGSMYSELLGVDEIDPKSAIIDNVLSVNINGKTLIEHQAKQYLKTLNN